MSTPDKALLEAMWSALKHRCAAHAPAAHDKVKRLVMVSEADLRSALSAAEAQGWVLVPKVPTEAMLIDGAARLRDFYSEAAPFCRTKAMYRAMLAAIAKEPG